MTKKAVSASFQKAAHQLIKFVSTAKKTRENHPLAEQMRDESGKQKATISVNHKAADSRKKHAKKGDISKSNPSYILKQVQRESMERNKHQSNHINSLTETEKKKHSTKKHVKEVLERIGVGHDRRSYSNRGVDKVYLPIDDYYISSRFGEDRGDHIHSGIDLAVSEGTSVTAVKSGNVVFAGWSSGYGYRIVIDHGDGSETTYSHLSDIGVEKGDKVVAGNQIGLSGNTGHSTGPHLHFEVMVDGAYVNPESYFDFGDGLVAPTDETYVSKISASTKGSNMTSQKYANASSQRLSPILSLVNETTEYETYFSPQNRLSQMTSSHHFSRREKEQKNVADRETNVLIELIPAYQQSIKEKRTKQTEETKRKE